MQRVRDREQIFPVKDAASAALMLIKADRLHTAGIISEAEKQWVYSRARTFLMMRRSKTLRDSPDRKQAPLPAASAPNLLKVPFLRRTF